jgi:hypothetical protein
MPDPQARRPRAGIAAGSFADMLVSALGHDAHTAQQPARALPVAQLAWPQPASTAYYTVSPIDAWGRLADRSPLRVLQWRPGHPLAVSVAQEAIVIVARPDGHESITRQGHLRLPAPIRHLLRLQTGDRLLLVACPDRGILVAHTMSTLDAMVLAHHAATPGRAAP